MKFSHSLQINSVPEWTEYYLNYAHLKRLIYQLEKVNVKPVLPNDSNHVLNRKGSSGYKPVSMGEETISETILPLDGDNKMDGQNNTSEQNDGESDSSSVVMRNSNSVFVAALDSELERIITFYMKMEKLLIDRFQQLFSDIEFSERCRDSRVPQKGRSAGATDLNSNSQDLVGSKAASPKKVAPQSPDDVPLLCSPIRKSADRHASAHAGFVKQTCELFVELNELKDFVDLNLTGFVKILKKYGKVTGSQLREWYLGEVVNVAYPFLPDTRKRIDQMIKRMVQVYAYLSGETFASNIQELGVISKADLELALSDLAVNLREKIIWERNTIWREMVEKERKSTNIGVQKALAEPSAPLFQIFLWGGEVAVPKPNRKFYILVATAALFVALLCTPMLDRPEAQNCLAILVLAICFWAFEVIPLFVTSLIVPMLVVLLRVMRAEGQRLDAPHAAKAVFGSMFSPVIMLLLGGFTLAAALSKHHIAKSLAALILSRAGTRPANILLVNMAVACFASMWISNVAAPVLCFSLIQPILRTLPSQSSYGKCLILGIAMASNIGGMASPISSPQNIIALQNLVPAATWPQWLLVSVPLCSICVVAVWVILVAFFKPNSSAHTHPPSLRPQPSVIVTGDTVHSSTPRTSAATTKKNSASNNSVEPRFNGTQFYVCLVCLLTIALWIAESFFESVLGDMGVVAILPIVLFFGSGVLGKDDFNNFLWTVMVLAMGGISLGKAVDSSGLLNIITSYLVPVVSHLSVWQQFAFFAAVVGVATTFISHTVGALIILPIVASVGNAVSGDVEPYGNLLVMGCAFMCSAAMGLPVSSFPNMNAISLEDPTGKPWLSAVDFMKIGILSTVASWFVVVSLGYLLLTFVGF